MRLSCDKDDARLKRHAIQIATQLPENREEALRVLDYARELVDWEDETVERPVLELIG